MIAFLSGLGEAAPDGVRRVGDRYLHVLKQDQLPRPRYVVHNNLGSKWLGRCVLQGGEPTSTIHLQKVVFEDADTLSRVIAHEIIHHVQFMTDPPTQSQIKFGTWDGHGVDFELYSEMINAHENRKDFVTKKSDQSYVLTTTVDKNVWLLIFKRPNDRWGWQWATRLTPLMSRRVQSIAARNPVKLVSVKKGLDRYFATPGARIGQRGLLVADTEHAPTLQRLYEETP